MTERARGNAPDVQFPEFLDSTVIGALPPRPHQVEGFRCSWSREAFALTPVPGAGKTKMLLDTAVALHRAALIDTVLVLAPQTLRYNWATEWARHWPGYPSLVGISGGNAAQKRAWAAALAAPPGPVLRILLVGLEQFQHTPQRPGAVAQEVLAAFFAPGTTKTAMRERLARGRLGDRRVLFIVDEAHFIKTPGANRTKNITKLAPLAAYRRTATGTPVTQGLEDVFAQYRFLDPGIIGAGSLTAFKSEYCVEVGLPDTNQRIIVGYRNVEALRQRLRPYTFTVGKDVLGLPEQIFHPPIDIPLLGEQRRLYTELRDYLITEVREGHVLEVQLSITKILRLHQIAAGHVPIRNEQGQTTGWHPVPTGKLAKVVELVQQAPKKVLVWASYKPDILQIAEALRAAGVACVTYYGNDTEAGKLRAQHRFKTDDTVRVLVGTPRSGGVGNTFNEATRTIYYNNTGSYEQRLQSQDRNHRIGQVEPVEYFDLVTGTVDRRFWQILQNKRSVSELLRTEAQVRAFVETLTDDRAEGGLLFRPDALT